MVHEHNSLHSNHDQCLSKCQKKSEVHDHFYRLKGPDSLPWLPELVTPPPPRIDSTEKRENPRLDEHGGLVRVPLPSEARAQDQHSDLGPSDSQASGARSGAEADSAPCGSRDPGRCLPFAPQIATEHLFCFAQYHMVAPCLKLEKNMKRADGVHPKAKSQGAQRPPGPQAPRPVRPSVRPSVCRAPPVALLSVLRARAALRAATVRRRGIEDLREPRREAVVLEIQPPDRLTGRKKPIGSSNIYIYISIYIYIVGMCQSTLLHPKKARCCFGLPVHYPQNLMSKTITHTHTHMQKPVMAKVIVQSWIMMNTRVSTATGPHIGVS